MNNKEIKIVTDNIKRGMPYEHNWKLIETVVRQTVKQMEARPWWKRLFKK